MNRALPVVSVLLSLSLVVNAQKKPTTATSSLCTKENALDTTKQQILTTRTFDNQVHRIAVLIRAADLLWPYDQEGALAAFTEAFDLATQILKRTAMFREMGKLDFDGSLIQATTFTDKSLRALTTLAVIEPCFDTKTKKKT